MRSIRQRPVVLTAPGLELSWEQVTGRHAVTSLVGQPTGERLHVAIQAALAAAAQPGSGRAVADANAPSEGRAHALPAAVVGEPIDPIWQKAARTLAST